MNILTILALAFTLSNGVAGTISFVGPCEKAPLAINEFHNVQGKTIGEVTIESLDKLAVPYAGNDRGLNSVFSTPTGLEAMEVISDTEMLAYGWCYSVNGFEPALFPSEITAKENDTILWWFGYAHFKDGEWITQCTPSYERRADQFCSTL